MHFHLPKPLHGWREFAGEVGIIVIGVLIALGAEGVVERWHWQHQVEQAKDGFRTELLVSASDAYERLAVQPCLQGRLRALAIELNGAQGQWRAMPEKFNAAGKYYSNIMPVVYRPPVRAILSDAWRNALANGTVNHIDPSQAETIGALYGRADDFRTLEAEEGSTETRLTPLGFDRPLDERTRVEMLQTLAQLDRLNDRLVSDSNDLLDGIRGLKLGIAQKEAESIRNQALTVQRSYRGACVRTDLPLNLGQG
jgi:hypothetical protein